MAITIETEKSFDKILHPIRIFLKKAQQSRNKKNVFNLMKGIYEKPTANNIFLGENMNAFTLRSDIRQECLLSLCYITLSWSS